MGIIAKNGKIQDEKNERVEESIRRLGNRIGILEKKVEKSLRIKSQKEKDLDKGVKRKNSKS